MLISNYRGFSPEGVNFSMKKSRQKTLKLSRYIIRYYLNTIFVIVALSFIVLLVSSYAIFNRISDSVQKSLPETISSIFLIINEKTKLLAHRYAEDFISTINSVEQLLINNKKDAIQEFLKSELSTKYSETYSQINYYLIDKNGIITETDYATDVGLNLAVYETFWRLLNKELNNNGYYIQSIGSEIKTGTRRIYVYKKLKNDEILELGFLIEPSLFEDSFKTIKDISVFLEQVSILFNGIPISPIFDPPPEKRISTISYKRLYKQERFFEYSVIEGLISQNFTIYMRTNFYLIFLIIEMVFTAFVVIIISVFVYSNKFSKQVSKEIDKIEEAITEYGNTGFYTEHKESFIEEINDALHAFSNLSEIISANVQEITASNEELEAAYKEIQNLSKEIREAFFDFSLRLSYIVEGFEEGTAKHLNRVKFIVEKLCEKLVNDPYLKEDIIYFSSLHDIGKVFIPQEILNKPGPLTPEEWEEMKKHTIYAERVLSHPRFKVALNIAKYHHENYDGTGYPLGLKGEDIPLEARIVKIADVYDALVSNRPYKQAYSKEKALKIIFEGDGRVNPNHFDPKVLEAFKEIAKEL